MRHGWVLLLLVGCTEQEKGQFGVDNGIAMSASSSSPIAVGASYPFAFYDQCVPTRDSFCDYDSVRSVGSATVNGMFEVTTASSTGIVVKANGPGGGQMRATITQTDGETKSFDRSFSALAADRATMYCYGFQDSTEPQLVVSGSKLDMLFATLYSGTTQLYSEKFFPFTAPGLTVTGSTVMAPATPGAITLTASFDPDFSFPLEVVSLDQIDKLELVKVPQTTSIYVGIKIMPTVGGREMCRPPWEAMTLTAGPAAICNVTQTLNQPAQMPMVQLHQQGTCHVEGRITGTSLVATVDFSL